MLEQKMKQREAIQAANARLAGKGGELSHHETTTIGGALDLTRKTAEDVLTPISENFTLQKLQTSHETLDSIMSRGHSRIPIYSGNRNNIIGLILHTTRPNLSRSWRGWLIYV